MVLSILLKSCFCQNWMRPEWDICSATLASTILGPLWSTSAQGKFLPTCFSLDLSFTSPSTHPPLPDPPTLCPASTSGAWLYKGSWHLWESPAVFSTLGTNQKNRVLNHIPKIEYFFVSFIRPVSQQGRFLQVSLLSCFPLARPKSNLGQSKKKIKLISVFWAWQEVRLYLAIPEIAPNSFVTNADDELLAHKITAKQNSYTLLSFAEYPFCPLDYVFPVISALMLGRKDLLIFPLKFLFFLTQIPKRCFSEIALALKPVTWWMYHEKNTWLQDLTSVIVDTDQGDGIGSLQSSRIQRAHKREQSIRCLVMSISERQEMRTILELRGEWIIYILWH